MKLITKQILRPRKPLRRVNQASEEYQALRESISKEGLLQPITVFRLPSDDYELIDGSHRLQAHIDLGLLEIEVLVQDVLPENSLKQQVIHNAHRIALNPVDVAIAIKHLLGEREISQRELGRELNIPQGWISRNLFLADCENENIIKAVNDQKLLVSNARSLLKLPKTFLEAFLPIAIEWKHTEFSDLVDDLLRTRIANYQEALEYVGIKHKVLKRYRGDSKVLSEIRTLEAYKELKKRKEFKDIESAWKVALKWCIQQDELGSVGLAQSKKAENRRKNFKKT